MRTPLPLLPLRAEVALISLPLPAPLCAEVGEHAAWGAARARGGRSGGGGVPARAGVAHVPVPGPATRRRGVDGHVVARRAVRPLPAHRLAAGDYALPTRVA